MIQITFKASDKWDFVDLQHAYSRRGDSYMRRVAAYILRNVFPNDDCYWFWSEYEWSDLAGIEHTCQIEGLNP